MTSAPSSEASPRPWEVRPWKNSIGVCNPNIKDNYQSRVAECHFWGEGSHLDRKTCEANAALIVQAVNSYDESRELLEDALKSLERACDWLYNGFEPDNQCKAYGACRQDAARIRAHLEAGK